MIKVKLKPEQGIKVRLSPGQSPDVDLKTVYLYDDDWIPAINNAITDAHNYAESAKESEQNAAQSASDADADATNAAESATIAYNSEQNAIAQANKATEEANAAAESAYQAQTSALAAYEYASNAEADAQNALETLGHVLEAETNATNAATTATEKATEAGTHATNASVSATNAKTSEDNAKNHELGAKGYSETATQEANASAESAYQSQQSALASSQYASDAESDAQNALETLGHVLESETISTNAANTATQKATVATQQAEKAEEKAGEASQFALDCQAIKDSLGSVYKFKGSVSTYNDLPSSGNEVGDVYDVIDTGKNYAWDGEKWDDIGGTVDLSDYAKKTELPINSKTNTPLKSITADTTKVVIDGVNYTTYSVYQRMVSDDKEYPIGIKGVANTTSNSSTMNFCADATINPSKGSIKCKELLVNGESVANKEYVDTTEQEIIENYMQADTDLQTQITGQATAITEAQGDIVNLQNNKQAVISDLDTIRSGAGKGATAVQPNDLSTVATSGSYNDLTNKPTIPTTPSQVGALPDTTKYGADLSYSDDKLQLLDQDGNALGSAVEIKASGGSSNDVFDHKWADHILNDMSWVRADTFSWQDGTVYSNAYNHLTNEYLEAVSAQSNVPYSETISGTTIYYWLAADGHKIVTQDQESNVQSIYNSTGVAWYYIVDTVNQRFKLPRTRWGLVGLRDSVGKYVPESLPDHLHNLTVNGTYDNYGPWYGTAGKADYAQTYTAKTQLASATSPVYGGTEVQQRATQMYLYFYVGNFTQSAIEQTAGLNAALFNGKVDLDAANLSTTGKSLISGFGMPSNRYIDLTLGASGASYTAPANGWFSCSSQGVVNIMLSNQEFSLTVTGASGFAPFGFMPVKKGELFVFTYSSNQNNKIRFYYAEGEQ